MPNHILFSCGNSDYCGVARRVEGLRGMMSEAGRHPVNPESASGQANDGAGVNGCLSHC